MNERRTVSGKVKVRVVSFTPRPLYPREKAPAIHWIGCCVGPRACMDAVVKRNIPSLRRESNSVVK